MDCDKFEPAMMDELYGELDELTSAAVKRHIASCSRCAALFEGLRATRRVASLVPVEPPFDLENRILAAAYSAPVAISIGRRAARAISVAGSWAMRPQTAMAAVFLVMIGTSGLLLRGKSSRAPASAAMTVTEEGTPAPAASAAPAQPAPPQVAAAPPPPAATNAGDTAGGSPGPAVGAAFFAEGPRAPVAVAKRGRPSSKSLPSPLAQAAVASAGNAPPRDGPFPSRTAVRAAAEDEETVATSSGPSPSKGLFAERPVSAPSLAAPAAAVASSPFDSALAAYRARRFDEAARAFDALSAADAAADLWAARSVREGSGCSAAVARFDQVTARAPRAQPGWDAALEGAHCYRLLGDAGAARARLVALLKVTTFADRARAELEGLSRASQPPAAAPNRP